VSTNDCNDVFNELELAWLFTASLNAAFQLESKDLSNLQILPKDGFDELFLTILVR